MCCVAPLQHPRAHRNGKPRAAQPRLSQRRAAAVTAREEGTGARCRSSHTASEQGSHGRVLGHRVTGLGALRGAQSGLAVQGASCWFGGEVIWIGFCFFNCIQQRFSFERSVCCCVEAWLTAGLGNTASSLQDGQV